jgi:hypothetical protein
MNYSTKSYLRLRAVGGIAASLTVLAFLAALALAASPDETTGPNQAAGVEPSALDPAGLALAMSLETAPAPQPIESEWPYPDAPVQQAETICYDDFGDATECQDIQPDQYRLAKHSAGDGQVDLAACGPEINDADPQDCLSQE